MRGSPARGRWRRVGGCDSSEAMDVRRCEEDAMRAPERSLLGGSARLRGIQPSVIAESVPNLVLMW